MSHHAEDFDPEMFERIKKIIGPTGKSPEGKLTKMDEGEIAFTVFRRDKKVIIDFGSQVTWLGMNGNQAIDIGNALIKHGRKVNALDPSTI